MTTTAQDVIAAAIDDLNMNARPDSLTVDQCDHLINGLEDGDALEALGFGDDDREAVEEAHDLLKTRRRAELLNSAPGYASEVWGGWVWVCGEAEMKWSKRKTRSECERAVEQAIDMHGIDRAFVPE